MLLKYFYNPRLAQASYLVGCEAEGTAIVIDPGREITPYIEAALASDLRIDWVAETHIHADFVSGSRELAAATGAKIAVSGMGGAEWAYQFLDANLTELQDGEQFMIGKVRFEVIHTPGHTPEHISLQVTDTAVADAPMGIFTGDFLFAGDVGRPDLLENAVGILQTAEPGAKQQYANIQKFAQMDDYLHIWPGHGAGSACGKSLGAVPSTTLGYEKRFNPAFHQPDENTFVEWLLSGQPETPHYFARMKDVNQRGAELLRDIPQAQHIQEYPEGIVPPGSLFIDTRPPNDFAQRHIPGSVNIPISSTNFTTYVGWFVEYDLPTFFLSYHNEVIEILKNLFSIGVDNVPGYFTTEVLKDVRNIGIIKFQSPREIEQADMLIIDVRGEDEYASQHIPDVLHIPMGHILQRRDEIPQDRPVALHCGSGIRSQIAISVLQREGYTNLVNMSGGIARWVEDGFDVEEA